MIDIRFLRENPDAVKENIRKKFQDAKLPLVDEVIALDEESRKTQAEADDLRSKRNKVSKQISCLMKSVLFGGYIVVPLKAFMKLCTFIFCFFNYLSRFNHFADLCNFL